MRASSFEAVGFLHLVGYVCGVSASEWATRLVPEREQRIISEIVVDAYGPEERAMGWFYYLEEHLQFPFRTKCIRARPISPLHKGEEVTVVGMAPEEDCESDMLVIIE